MFLPISLDIRRQPDVGGADFFYPSSQAKTEKILRRDDYACRCCGFKAHRFQRAISAGAIRGAKDEYVTVCLFCELCFALDRVGVVGEAALVWLPELAQAELNHALRAIFVASLSDHPSLAETASRTLDALMTRRAEAKKRLGSDDPLLLATVFQEEMDDQERAAAGAKLEGIRLMPLGRFAARGTKSQDDPMTRMARYWMSPEGPFAALPVARWTALFESISAKTAPAR